MTATTAAQHRARVARKRTPLLELLACALRTVPATDSFQPCSSRGRGERLVTNKLLLCSDDTQAARQARTKTTGASTCPLLPSGMYQSVDVHARRVLIEMNAAPLSCLVEEVMMGPPNLK